MSITLDKKPTNEFTVSDLGSVFVEEILFNETISNSVYTGNNETTKILAWDKFAFGWAISKGVPLEVATKFVKRYSGRFYPQNTRDDA